MFAERIGHFVGFVMQPAAHINVHSYSAHIYILVLVILLRVNSSIVAILTSYVYTYPMRPLIQHLFYKYSKCQYCHDT